MKNLLDKAIEAQNNAINILGDIVESYSEENEKLKDELAKAHEEINRLKMQDSITK